MILEIGDCFIFSLSRIYFCPHAPHSSWIKNWRVINNLSNTILLARSHFFSAEWTVTFVKCNESGRSRIHHRRWGPHSTRVRGNSFLSNVPKAHIIKENVVTEWNCLWSRTKLKHLVNTCYCSSFCVACKTPVEQKYAYLKRIRFRLVLKLEVYSQWTKANVKNNVTSQWDIRKFNALFIFSGD